LFASEQKPQAHWAEGVSHTVAPRDPDLQGAAREPVPAPQAHEDGDATKPPVGGLSSKSAAQPMRTSSGSIEIGARDQIE
jgi:hypothetical protein